MSAQQIQFCKICDNKYYHKLTEDDEEALVYYCRVCGNQEDNIGGSCVLNIQYDNTNTNTNYEQIVNKYTKYDPTLPHIHIPCPNDECKSNKTNAVEQKNNTTDAVYIRYDHVNMKHLYMCTACDHLWKTH
jgi:DNA-directed RNA polymerase subunit M/transcription elongation factor TFIIS